jgi:putative pyoverdin transport system ATP-binding/permease protein
MKLLFDFFAKRSSTSLPRLFWAASLSGLTSALILYILNTGASHAAQGAALAQLLFMFVVAELIFVFCQRYLLLTSLRETEKVLHLYRQQQIERVRHCDLDVFERIGPARFFSAVTQQTKILSSSIAMIVMASQFVVVVLFALLYLAWLSVPAVVLTLLILGIGWAVYRSRMAVAHVKFAQASHEENAFFDSINDLVHGFKEIRLNAARSADFAAFATAISQRVVGFKGEIDGKLTDMFLFSHMIFFGLAAVMVFLLPGLGIVKSEELLKIVTVVLFLIGPIVNVLGSAAAVANAQAACTQMLDLEQQLEAATTTSRATAEQIHQFDEIGLRAAAFRHVQPEEGEGFQVGPLDLLLRRGELLFISGGNGSGKSTLLRLLTALYLPQEGELVLDGRTIGPDRREAYQGLFSTVFSDFHLFERTFGLGDVSEAQATQWLSVMGLADKTALRNRRFDTIKLSTGQRKRLALVVALLEDRPIYVLDEFAADQDPEFRRKFYDEILPAMRERGKTVVVVTHDERYFDRASRHLTMEEGRIVQRGAADG